MMFNDLIDAAFCPLLSEYHLDNGLPITGSAELRSTCLLPTFVFFRSVKRAKRVGYGVTSAQVPNTSLEDEA